MELTRAWIEEVRRTAPDGIGRKATYTIATEAERDAAQGAGQGLGGQEAQQ